MFITMFLKCNYPKSAWSLSTLHSFVAPVIIRAASVCIASSCFLISVEALSHTESLYSKRGRVYEMYIFSRACLLSLNFKILKRFNLPQAVVAILLMYSFQLHVLEHVRPRCLCDVVSSIIVSFM